MPYPLPNASHDLTGQLAIITGASSGLGARFARVLAAAGATVAVCARRVDRLEALVADITAAGGKARAFALDAADQAQCVGLAERVEAELGPVSILINNAGIPDAARAHKVSLELYNQVMAVNVNAPWLLSTSLAARRLADGGALRIVNMASMAAFEYNGHGAALYSMTKAAVVRMTEVLSVEWAKFPINVNAIAPGAFASEMMDGMMSRMGDITQHFRRKRLGDPAMMDSTLLYLVSPAGEAVTGTIIKIDDGQSNR
ncbi:short-chain dehydrogenase [Sandarakinorhabdus cyanobacteriorum]|uniref:Short-chain dehydrogenase n=1 Tax=Sandarakinorhabdus cyanobacteriorum TaxID=1981098 RepID=A0A255YI34_9SPHN|nr:SDR family NAD(P)-dependent oxidoreductase [Sandarakinorhabdus cyanobacteriorum]OYQ28838.1 short-chain dehydrogenase [Sandarakinorhabdus cyanobacteriorum]